MTYWLWLTTSLTLSVAAEYLARLHGLELPFTLATAFYFALQGPSWLRTAVPLMLATTWLDSLSTSTLPQASCVLLLIFPLADFWRRFGDVRSLPMLVFPGAAVGILAALCRILNAIVSGHRLTAGPIWQACCLLGASTVLIPALAFLLELPARRLAIRRLEKINFDYSDDYYFHDGDTYD